MEKNKVVFSYRLVITTKKNIVNKFSKTLPSSFTKLQIMRTKDITFSSMLSKQ
jgi:hypothetical protein